MIQKLKPLLLSMTLISTPALSSGIELLMDGGPSGPAPDEMNFRKFFTKVEHGALTQNPWVCLSKDGKRTLQLDVTILKHEEKSRKDIQKNIETTTAKIQSLTQEIETNPSEKNKKTLISKKTKFESSLKKHQEKLLKPEKPTEMPEEYWLSSNQQKNYSASFPSLDSTPDAPSLFSTFSSLFMLEALGQKMLPTPQHDLDANFVTAALKDTKHISDLYESISGSLVREKDFKHPRDSTTPPKKKKRLDEKKEAERKDLKRSRDDYHAEYEDKEALKNPSSPKRFKDIDTQVEKGKGGRRPKFTQAFLLNTIYEGEEHEAKIAQSLSDYVSSKCFAFDRFFLIDTKKGNGYVHVSLKSFLTPDNKSSDDFYLKYANRVPLQGIAVIPMIQTVFEAICNKHFKELVYDKEMAEKPGMYM